jgi:hypothetical protein
MKKGSTLFLKGVIIVIGLVVAVFCAYVLPRIIGSFDMGGYDPILIGMYLPAIPFFIALFHGFRLLGNIDRNAAFTASSVNSLTYIKRCAASVALLYSAGMPYIFRVAEIDDAPGVVAIGLIIVGASIVVAVFAAVLQKLLQNGMEIKSENDLVV